MAPVIFSYGKQRGRKTSLSSTQAFHHEEGLAVSHSAARQSGARPLSRGGRVDCSMPAQEGASGEGASGASPQKSKERRELKRASTLEKVDTAPGKEDGLPSVGRSASKEMRRSSTLGKIEFAAGKEEGQHSFGRRSSMAEPGGRRKSTTHGLAPRAKKGPASVVKYTLHGRRERVKKDGESKGTTDSWMRGDDAFETPEMKATRAAMRHEPKVAAVLDLWWDTTDLDGNGCIDRDEYVELGKALYRSIIGDGNEEEALKSAIADWEEDSKGHSAMDGDHFKEAIFELADLWTDTLEADEYVAFLEDLLAKMKKNGLGRGIGYVHLHRGESFSRRPPLSRESSSGSIDKGRRRNSKPQDSGEGAANDGGAPPGGLSTVGESKPATPPGAALQLPAVTEKSGQLPVLSVLLHTSAEVDEFIESREAAMQKERRASLSLDALGGKTRRASQSLPPIAAEALASALKPNSIDEWLRLRPRSLGEWRAIDPYARMPTKVKTKKLCVQSAGRGLVARSDAAIGGLPTLVPLKASRSCIW